MQAAYANSTGIWHIILGMIGISGPSGKHDVDGKTCTLPMELAEKCFLGRKSCGSWEERCEMKESATEAA